MIVDDKDAYSLVRQTPGIEDYMRLRKISGLTPFEREAAEIGLKGTIFAAVVLHEGGHVLRPDSVTKIGWQRLQEAGVKKTSIHRLRAVFATRALRAFIQAFSSKISGISPNSNFGSTILTLVAELMGHRSTESLHHYLNAEFHRIARNSEAFKLLHLEEAIAEKERLAEALERRIQHDKVFNLAFDRLRQGDTNSAIDVMKRMVVNLEDEVRQAA